MFEQVSVEPPPSRLRSIGRALPRVGLAVFFVLVGYSKFNSDPRGEWVQIFERIGVGQWLRYVTGVMQVGGAILLLPRRTLTVGAAMLACTMAGAALVDLFILPSPIVIVPLLLLMIVIVVWLTA
jgi:putative oxidoreductase